MNKVVRFKRFQSISYLIFCCRWILILVHLSIVFFEFVDFSCWAVFWFIYAQKFCDFCRNFWNSFHHGWWFASSNDSHINLASLRISCWLQSGWVHDFYGCLSILSRYLVWKAHLCKGFTHPDQRFKLSWSYRNSVSALTFFPQSKVLFLDLFCCFVT